LNLENVNNVDLIVVIFQNIFLNLRLQIKSKNW